MDLLLNENVIDKGDGSAFIVVKPVSASEYVAEHPLAATLYKTSIQEYYYVSQNGSDPGTVDFSSIATNAAWSSSIPKTSIPGTYDVWVAVKGTNGKTSGPIKLSPSVLPKADPAFSTSPVAVENQVYDGTPKNLVSEGSFGSLVNSVNPTVLYAVTDTATRPNDNVFTTGIPSKTESGIYYVWYRVAGDNYYNAKNNYEPITVEILEPEPAPVITAPVYTYEPVKEEVKEEPKPAVFTMKNKDGSSTTITIIRNTDGTVTTVTENKYPDGITETKSETRDAKGNGTLSKIKKDADGNVLSKTEGTIKVNKKGTETLKSVTENSDGSREEKTQKTYKRDADNIKKVTADTKKTDAAGNTEETKMTALVDGLGGATITESSTFKYAEADGISADSKEGKESDSASPTAKDSNSKSGKIVKEERQYSLSVNGGLKLLSLTSDGEKVKIPESIELDGMVRVVKSIGKNALKGNKTVREVVIGKDVTTICAGAFKNCSNLELIELTGSVKKIYKNAFKGIAKNARFVIEASEEDFARIVQLLKDSGVSDTVTLERK
ncbi:MAG: leucine-rich repeat protein [Lachnospiraceae bacterium]|nr:leucine-rich repeat protein [Lachnospiraceae bacterium]